MYSARRLDCGRYPGYSIGEGSAVTANPTGQYLAGCANCTLYATGKNMEGALHFRLKNRDHCCYLEHLFSVIKYGKRRRRIM